MRMVAPRVGEIMKRMDKSDNWLNLSTDAERLR
jgi:hypothetical protein